MNGHNRSPLATAGGYLEHKRGTTTVDQVGLNLRHLTCELINRVLIRASLRLEKKLGLIV